MKRQEGILIFLLLALVSSGVLATVLAHEGMKLSQQNDMSQIGTMQTNTATVEMQIINSARNNSKLQSNRQSSFGIYFSSHNR